MKNKIHQSITESGRSKSIYGDFFTNGKDDRKIYTNGVSVWDNKGKKVSNPSTDTLKKFL